MRPEHSPRKGKLCFEPQLCLGRAATQATLVRVRREKQRGPGQGLRGPPGGTQSLVGQVLGRLLPLPSPAGFCSDRRMPRRLPTFTTDV